MADVVKLCEKCHHPMIFRTYVKTGKSNPIDARPCADGNILLDDDGVHYSIVPPAVRDRYPGRLYKSHYATCPSAADFKARGRGRS